MRQVTELDDRGFVIFGVRSGFGHNLGQPNDRRLPATVINEDPIFRLHASYRVYRLWIPDPVPVCLPVSFQIIDGIRCRFGFCEKVCVHHDL